MTDDSGKGTIASAGAAIVLLAAIPLAGCASLDLFGGGNEPLPPVTGNVIATASNRTLPPPGPAPDDPFADAGGQVDTFETDGAGAPQ